MAFTELLHADQLTLIPATADHVRAELRSVKEFGALLAANVPASWPPGQYDRDAQEYFLKSLEESGADGVGWFGWYAVRREQSSTLAATLVGCGGYFGPPSPEGVVEIGYSVCPEFTGRGYATSMTRALALQAIELPHVTRVIAHTDQTNEASITVLLRSNFRQAAETDQPGTLLFEWF